MTKSSGALLLWALLVVAYAPSNAQRLVSGNPTWISGNAKLYVIPGKVGIGTNDPLRKLHIKDAGHQYIRTSSTGGDQFHTYVAALELQRTLDNGQARMWDIVNQGTFKIRRETHTLFHLDQYESQLGTQTNKTSFRVWGNPVNGALENGTLIIQNHHAGQPHTMILDGDQIEGKNDVHINYASEHNLDLVHGGGNVRIGTDDNEARLNIRADDKMQLKLSNNTNNWRIGASNNSWLVGDGKLVFSKSANSQDATMVLTSAGNVGIGLTTPSKTLQVNGVTSTKVLEITGGADLAEHFDIEESDLLLPGTVVSISSDDSGKLRVSHQAYDKKVAGIVSGAGNIQPGMLMGQEGSIANGKHPVALTGRVYCQVDASYGAVEPGDLLTTSDTPGHAMKVTNHDNGRGAIIGKAMTSLNDGKGLVLVLVSLQ